METHSFLIKFGAGTLLFVGLFFVSRAEVRAATLYLSPSNGSYLVGRTFTVSVMISSPDTAMNAAQGSLSFPADKLSIVSLSKTNSIMTIWVQDPSYSNLQGTVNFGGVVVNPGYEGADGKLFTVTFQVKSTGQADISFTDGSVLANDGQGTNILGGFQNASFAFGSISANPSASSVSIRPFIRTTPSFGKNDWVSIDTITFQWSMPIDVDGVNYAISNSPDYQLPRIVNPAVSQVTYDLSQYNDGTWYFYAAFESGGIWSPASLFAFHLDRTPPEPFLLQKNDGVALLSASPVFRWVATDKTSGVSHYEVKIGDGDWFDATTIAKGGTLYELPFQSPTAARTLTVRAYDKAGNYRGASLIFSVDGSTCNHGFLLPCFLGDIGEQWSWVFALIMILTIAFAYTFVFRGFVWRRRMKRELMATGAEIRNDLRSIRARMAGAAGNATGCESTTTPSISASGKKALEKDLRAIEEQIKKEIDRLKDLETM